MWRHCGAALLTDSFSFQVGWREDSRKVVVLATDDSYHEAGDGTASGLTPNNGDGVFDGGDGAGGM